MPLQKLTPEIITAAVEGFEQQKRRIDVQIAELRALREGHGPVSRGRPPSYVSPTRSPSDALIPVIPRALY